MKFPPVPVLTGGMVYRAGSLLLWRREVSSSPEGLPWGAVSGGPCRCPAVTASWSFVRRVALLAVALIGLAPLGWVLQ